VSDLLRDIGLKIKELRTARNVSQQELAEYMNISPNTVSRWETNVYRPAIDDLSKLADYFGVSISTFFPNRPLSPDIEDLVDVAHRLDDEELKEVLRYAYYRLATAHSQKA